MDSISNAFESSFTIINSIAKENAKSVKSNSNLDEKLQAVLSQLKICEENIRNDPTVNRTAMRDKTISILNNLDQELNNQKEYLKPSRLHRYHEKLERAARILSNALELKEITKSPKEEGYVRLAFICDIDCPDHNGSMFGDCITMAFNSKIPFVTTRSLFSCAAAIPCGMSLEKPIYNIEKKLFEANSEWEIFCQNDPIYGQEFLVFIPKSVSPGKEGNQLLASLDLNVDGTLKKINPTDAFLPSQKRGKYEAFEKLFNSEQKKGKLFFFAGHGEVGAPAGMSVDNYKKFQTFLNKLNCKGLTIDSCYAGGVSTLIHTTQNEQKDISKNKNNEWIEPNRFPVIMRSIGDFSTIGGQSAEMNLQLYFNELENFANSDQPAIVAQFSKSLKKAEEGKSKVPENLAQIYFPPSSDSPGGFRPIGEGGESFALTYHRLIKERVSQTNQQQQAINIDNKEFIELHPPIIDIPLVFQMNAPIMLSMIPGKAQHYIEEIQLPSEESPVDLIQKNIQCYKDWEGEVGKGFFISKLVGDEEQWEQVGFVLAAKKESTCIYRKNGTYYVRKENQNDFDERPISAFQYKFILNSMLKTTMPQESAIRSSTGGQQEAGQLKDKIENTPAWLVSSELLKGSKEWINPAVISKMTTDQLKEILSEKSPNLSEEDKAAYLFHLFNCNRGDLVLLMMDYLKLSPDIKNWNGESLIFKAVEAKEEKLCQYLFENGADVNVLNAKKNKSLLALAISTNSPILPQLLAHPNIDVKIKHKDGSTPIFFTLFHNNLDTFNKLKSMGANPHETYEMNDSIWSILSDACHYCSIETFNLFLNAGLDPNLGDPPSLFWAIYDGDHERVDALLEKGANPLLECKNCFPPVFEAIKRTSPDIVRKIFNSKNFNPNFMDKYGVTPLTCAIRIGNKEYIRTLFEKGGRLPSSLSNDAYYLVKDGMERLVRAGDSDSLILILKNNDPKCQGLEEIICDSLLKNPYLMETILNTAISKEKIESNPLWQVSSELLKVGKEVIDPSIIGKMTTDQLNEIIASKLQNLSMNAKVTYLFHLLNCNRSDLVLCMMDTLKLSPNIKSRDGNSLIFRVAEREDKKLFSSLLEMGADVNVVNATKGKSLLTTEINKYSSVLLPQMLSHPKIDLNIKNADGSTPLFSTLCHFDLILFDKLLSMGANPDTTYEVGGAIISLLSISAGNPTIFKKLINYGLDPNLGDPPPLYNAICNGDQECVEALLKKGANPFQTYKNCLPLVFEAIGRPYISPDIVSMIFNHKDFNPNFIDPSGVTPLVWAICVWNIDFIQNLLMKGAQLPENLSEYAKKLLKLGIQHLLEANDFDSIELLLKNNKPFNLTLEELTCKSILQDANQTQTFLKLSKENPQRYNNTIRALSKNIT